jgi:phosphoribosylformylglycinamidine cyclo-ligase
MLPDGVNAKIKLDSYPIPPIFKLLQKTGGIDDRMMYNTYNMGLGMVLAVDKADAENIIKAIEKAGDKAFVVGEIVKGNKEVELV